METDAEWAVAIKDRLKAEIEHGGSLKVPCPMCGLPLCERSDYVRCQKCGKNWTTASEAIAEGQKLKELKAARTPAQNKAWGL
jgi:uncharacterized Zn finger protein (UPF0148 family)